MSENNIWEDSFLIRARTRSFVAFAVVGGGLSFLSSFIYLLEAFSDYPVFTLGTTLGPLILIAAPLYLRLGLDLERTQTFVLGFAVIFCAWTIYMAGGLMTRAPFFLVAICVASSLTTTWKKAAVINAATLGLLIWGHFHGVAAGTGLDEVMPTLSYAEISMWTLVSLVLALLLAGVATIFFVVEMNTAAAQLKAARVRAELANTSKSEFLANMSHEIRTPMNGILGIAQLIQQTGLDERQQKYAEIIETSGSALLTIINDILDLSSIEAGKLQIESLPFSAGEIAHDVAKLLDISAQGKGLELCVDVKPNVPDAVNGDPGRIRQALTNIVGNAVKFTERGHVRIDVDCDSVEQGVASIMFTVTDTGIGIPSHKLDQVFDKFTQAEDSISRDFGGTGLGLAITRSLINAMGGEIEVQSKPGVGSVFTIRLPLELTAERPALSG